MHEGCWRLGCRRAFTSADMLVCTSCSGWTEVSKDSVDGKCKSGSPVPMHEQLRTRLRSGRIEEGNLLLA